jgi:hypothetical protein
MPPPRALVEDGANHGERKYGGLKAAAEAAGFNYQTVRNCATVARRFELSRRRDNLEFGHHEAVAALPDEAAFRLLKDAEANELSVAELRLLADRERDHPELARKVDF